jgi:hypothetical protein
MSQRCVEMLLGKILTDENFRRSFFSARAFPDPTPNFEVAASQGLELTAVEKSALSALKPRRFELIAQTLDPRIARSGASSAEFERVRVRSGGGDFS